MNELIRIKHKLEFPKTSDDAFRWELSVELFPSYGWLFTYSLDIEFFIYDTLVLTVDLALYRALLHFNFTTDKEILDWFFNGWIAFRKALYWHKILLMQPYKANRKAIFFLWLNFGKVNEDNQCVL